MYTPINQRSGGASGGGGGGGFQPLQAPGTASLVQALQVADTAKRTKNAEMMRQYERAQELMKGDLNTLAGYDVSAVGVDAAPAMTKRAEALRVQIREANDPVQASALIAAFKKDFDMLVAKEKARKEAAKLMTDMVTADGQTMAGLNAALPVGQEYNEVDATTLANADDAYRKKYYYNDADGKIYVVGSDGEDVPLEEADFIHDFSAYNPTTRQADVGDLLTTAQSDVVQTMIKNMGGAWKRENARTVYDTLSENASREGQMMRLQILEDSIDENGRGNPFADLPNQQKAWQLGPNGYHLVKGNPDMEEAWREVWGEPETVREKDESGLHINKAKGWDLLDVERGKFVEYSRFAMDPLERERYEALRKSNKGEPAESPFLFNQMVAQTTLVERQGADKESDSDVNTFSLVKLREPRKVESSLAIESGSGQDPNPLDYAGLEDSYEIVGFGYDYNTSSGEQVLVARILTGATDYRVAYTIPGATDDAGVPIGEDRKDQMQVSQQTYERLGLKGKANWTKEDLNALGIPEGAIITGVTPIANQSDVKDFVLPTTDAEFEKASMLEQEIYTNLFGDRPGGSIDPTMMRAAEIQKQQNIERQMAEAERRIREGRTEG